MMQLLCVYDKKAMIYKNPWMAPSIPEAVRSLSLSIRKSDHKAPNMFAEFPDDYQICRLAEYDEFSGKLTCPPTPEILFEVRTLTDEELNAHANSV